MRYILILACILILCNCSEKVQESRDMHMENITFPVSKDSLISKIADMETSNLDCSADIYWQIVGQGKAYIPKLIESLTDTTMTNIDGFCGKEKLSVGDVSFLAMEQIAEFPAAVATGIQFCTFDENGCWSFYSYLLNKNSKHDFQSRIKDFYENSKFEFVEFPDSLMTSCRLHYAINGRYEYQDPIEPEKNSVPEEDSVYNAKFDFAEYPK